MPSMVGHATVSLSLVRVGSRRDYMEEIEDMPTHLKNSTVEIKSVRALGIYYN